MTLLLTFFMQQLSVPRYHGCTAYWQIPADTLM